MRLLGSRCCCCDGHNRFSLYNLKAWSPTAFAYFTEPTLPKQPPDYEGWKPFGFEGQAAVTFCEGGQNSIRMLRILPTDVTRVYLVCLVYLVCFGLPSL